MALVNQAEFARLHAVSRKAVTTWKQRGYLVMEGGLVNVDASNVKLSGAGRAWPEAVTRAAEAVTRPAEVSAGNALPPWPAIITDPGAKVGSEPRGAAAPEEVVNLAVMAEGATADMVALVLRYLPPEVIPPLADEFLAQQRRGAADIADEDYVRPRGLATWAHHPLFQGPAVLHYEWIEFQEEAAAWRAEQGKPADA